MHRSKQPRNSRRVSHQGIAREADVPGVFDAATILLTREISQSIMKEQGLLD